MGNDEKSLNRQIAEALCGELHYVEEAGETFFYRVGVDDLNGFAYGSLEDYEHSLDAVWEELPREWYDMRLCVLIAGGYEVRILRDDPPKGYVASWTGRGDTVQEAAARALLQWALAQRKDGA